MIAVTLTLSLTNTEVKRGETNHKLIVFLQVTKASNINKPKSSSVCST